MNRSITMTRMIFTLVSILVAMAYCITYIHDVAIPILMALGVFCGTVFSMMIVALDTTFKKLDLRTFNVTLIGLFLGYLLSLIVQFIFSDLFSSTFVSIPAYAENVFNATVTLSSLYIGVVITSRAAEEISIHIPFARLTPKESKKKDILLCPSVLSDPRLIDLASSGLLDNHLVIPRYIIHSFYEEKESSDENIKGKARRCLDVIKKLEGIPSLDVRYSDLEVSDVKDPLEKFVKLARVTNANILTLDISQIKQAEVEDVKIIKFLALCAALKPLTQSGEYIHIKIQRYGKEARQGVGYLDDGTMVVVNGGAEFIGETVKTQVLSVKHTSSGRMIFCNAMDDEMFDEENYETVQSQSGGHVASRQPNDYFAH